MSLRDTGLVPRFFRALKRPATVTWSLRDQETDPQRGRGVGGEGSLRDQKTYPREGEGSRVRGQGLVKNRGFPVGDSPLSPLPLSPRVQGERGI